MLMSKMNDYDLLQHFIQSGNFDEEIFSQLSDLVEFFKLFDQLPAGSHLAKYANGQWRVNVPVAYGWDRFIADTPLEAARKAIHNKFTVSEN